MPTASGLLRRENNQLAGPPAADAWHSVGLCHFYSEGSHQEHRDFPSREGPGRAGSWERHVAQELLPSRQQSLAAFLGDWHSQPMAQVLKVSFKATQADSAATPHLLPLQAVFCRWHSADLMKLLIRSSDSCECLQCLDN